MPESPGRHVGRAGWLIACAAAGLVCALPVNAGTIPTGHYIALERLVDPSPTAGVLIPAGGYSSGGTDTALGAAELPGDTLFAVLPDESYALDLLSGGQDAPGGSGRRGVRRFILLALLLGAVLRYLTSPGFCKWAADVLDPLGGY